MLLEKIKHDFFGSDQRNHYVAIHRNGVSWTFLLYNDWMICLVVDNNDTMLLTLVVMPQTTKKTEKIGAGLLKRLAACGNLFVQVGHPLCYPQIPFTI